MEYESKDNEGVLFRNQKKNSDKAPDYTGECKVNGKPMRMSAWINKSKSGNSYLKFAFSEPPAQQHAEKEHRQQTTTPQGAPISQPYDNFGAGNDPLPF